MLKEINPYPTLKELSVHSGVKFQTLNKAEKGLYTNLPTSIANELIRALSAAHHGNYSTKEIQHLYQQHRESLLNRTIEDIKAGRIDGDAFFTHPSDIPKYYDSWDAFRRSINESQIGFCEMFIFHQAILQKYEAGKMSSFPVGLAEVLLKVIESVQEPSSNTKEWIAAVKKLPREVFSG